MVIEEILTDPVDAADGSQLPTIDDVQPRHSEEDFQFTSFLPAVLAKCGREARRGRRSSVAVVPTPDFSVRCMTRSAAKATGYKPSSAIIVKATPLRRPRAKKQRWWMHLNLKMPHALPPPTPIVDLQAVGACLGIPEDQLTLEKLTASPKNFSSSSVPDDE